jgi:hypothetical protein
MDLMTHSGTTHVSLSSFNADAAFIGGLPNKALQDMKE